MQSLEKAVFVAVPSVATTLLDPNARSVADRNFHSVVALRKHIDVFQRIFKSTVNTDCFARQPALRDIAVTLINIPPPTDNCVEFEPDEVVSLQRAESVDHIHPLILIELTPFDHQTKNIDGRRNTLQPIAQGFK